MRLKTIAFAMAALVGLALWGGVASAGEPAMPVSDNDAIGNDDGEEYFVAHRGWGYYHRPFVHHYRPYSFYRPYYWSYSFYRPYYGGWYRPYYGGWSYYRPYYWGWSYYQPYYWSNYCYMPPAYSYYWPVNVDVTLVNRPGAAPNAAPDATYPYNGGPQNPVPMPRPDPEPKPAPPRTVEVKATTDYLPVTSKKHVYPAYGETPPAPAERTVVTRK